MLWWHKMRLRSNDPNARIRAIQKLAERGQLLELLPCLEDKCPSVVDAAARALKDGNYNPAVQALVERLRAPGAFVRESAARALGYVGDRAVLEPLADALADAHPKVRSAAAATLLKLGWNPVTPEHQAMFSIATGKARTAILAGEAAVTPLVRELKSDTAFVRRSVAEALESVDDPRVFQPLLAAARDEDPTVRVSVIHALSKVCNEPATIKLLHRMSGDRDQHVRLAAAQVLAKRGSAGDAEVFVRLLKDRNFEVRQVAAEFLGHLSKPEFAEALSALLADPDNDVRETAARAVARCGDHRCIGALVLLLGDEDSGVRQAAEGALGKIDSRWVLTRSAREAIPALQKVLTTRPTWVKAAAQHVIDRLQSSAAGGCARA